MNNDYLDKYLAICEKFYLRERPLDKTTSTFWIIPKFIDNCVGVNEIIYITIDEKIILYKILQKVFSDNYRLRNYFDFLINKTNTEKTDIENFKYTTEKYIEKLKELNEINFGSEDLEI
tara:strand:- start:254 stop:610 length:357 start_codon:yes stop_codon:yes gene_type:complete